jgi:hypothetical protein
LAIRTLTRVYSIIQEKISFLKQYLGIIGNPAMTLTQLVAVIDQSLEEEGRASDTSKRCFAGRQDIQ